MITDKENIFSDAQAITVDAISTNVIDLLPAAANTTTTIGTGTELILFVHVDVLLAGTSETIIFTLETDSTADLATSATTHITSETFTALAAGVNIYFPFIPDQTWERYLGVRYNVGGTSPTVTVTSGIIRPGVCTTQTFAQGANFK